MSSRPARLKLNKRYIATHAGYDFYSVNAFAVRDIAQPDEEFGILASREEFHDLIPEGQIWIAEKTLDKEGIFFVADALTRLKEEARGVAEDRAYEAGLNVERFLRERVNGVKFRGGRPHKRVPERIYVRPYETLPDVRFPVNVWVVDGNLV